MIKRDRNWNEAAARKQLLKFFEALGPTDPLAVDGRGGCRPSCSRERAGEGLALRSPANRSTGSTLPDTLPIFPLTGVLLLPRRQLPLNIFEPRYLAMTSTRWPASA